MSQTINIGGDPQDPTYRYRRNVIEIKHESGHGGRTHITNIELISKQLHVKIEAIQKTFKKNVPSAYHNDVINGIIEVSSLEIILEKFIKKYVLCPTCGLPELLESGVCSACGYTKETKKDKDILVTDKEFQKLADTFVLNKEIPVCKKYKKISDKITQIVEKKYPKDTEKQDLHREDLDYEATKDEWFPSDYGHSKLDKNSCELIHKLYEIRDTLDNKTAIETLIENIWRCQNESEFKLLKEQCKSIYG